MGRRKSEHRKKKNKMKIPVAVSSSAVALPPPPWNELPGDVTANILQRLGAIDIMRSAQVCTTWRRVCKDPTMWQVIQLKNPGDMHEQFSIMCRLAVDWSQGQLVNLCMDSFGDDELLNYTADRSSHLRRLTLDRCYEISGKGLTEAVKKLPHLEALHLTIMPSIHAGDVENIGISCPMLKSFTFNKRGYKPPEQVLDDGEPTCNDYALAITKTMPNLCHLQLFAYKINDQGLRAILDGCPRLESLDIR